MAQLAALAVMTGLMAAQASGVGFTQNNNDNRTAIERAHGPVPIPGHRSHSFHVNPDVQQVPVDLPVIEPRDVDPPSLPWDDLHNDMLLAQGDRSIQLNVPDIYVPKQEVETEPVKVQRDPLYPDDVKAYDVLRARSQRILFDSSNRNYAFNGYHIPYSVQNATHQEVAQSQNLAGRRASEYTVGATDNNGVLVNLKDPSAQIVRQQGDAWVDDRSTYQTWDKKQAGELVADIIQSPQPQDAAYNNPTEWMASTKQRASPKYLNAFENQHGYRRLQARDQRGEVASYDPLKMKRLLLLGDEGFRSSQTTYYGGHLNGLKYPHTTRKREILPSVSNPGLFQGQGTGFTFKDQNSGNPAADNTLTSSELMSRSVIVPKMYGLIESSGLGRSLAEHTEPPFRLGLNQNPTVDFIKQPVVHPAFYDKGEPHWWSDNVSIVVPLHR